MSRYLVTMPVKAKAYSEYDITQIMDTAYHADITSDTLEGILEKNLDKISEFKEWLSNILEEYDPQQHNDLYMDMLYRDFIYMHRNEEWINE